MLFHLPTRQSVKLLYLVFLCWKVSQAHSQTDGDLRLGGYGASHLKGRLEVFHNGSWGTVCSKNNTEFLPGSQFDLNSANVACRQLGLGYATVFYSPTFLPELRFRYGHGVGPIHLEDVNCDGTEPHLLRCSHGLLGHVTSTCTHAMDVIVECSLVHTPYSGEVRINDQSSGILELFSVGQWGAVCYQSTFGVTQANAACQQLGFTEAASYRMLSAGDYNGLSWRPGREATVCNITQCFTSCLHTLPEEVTSQCSPIHLQCAFTSDNAPTNPSGNSDLCTLPNLSNLEGDIRLVSYSSKAQNLVQYFSDGTWKAVCNMIPVFDYNEADVACKQLGYSAALSISNYDNVIMESLSLSCVGFETYVTDCNTTNTTVQCADGNKVGIKCTSYSSPYSELTLRGGAGSTGNILIFNGLGFQPICDVGFGMQEARVACRQLGYDRAIAVRSSSFFGFSNNFDLSLSNGLFQLDRRCLGTESNLLECNQPLLARGQCRRTLDEVGVQCGTEEADTPSIRLVAGDTISGRPISGRLEVNFGGAWGTVANKDGHFNQLAAHVACTYLGFPTARTVHNSTRYGEGTGPVVLKDVDCSGYENSILDCHHDIGISDNPAHAYDVGLECSEDLPFPINSLKLVSPSSNETAGRLDIFVHGVWMSVCGRNFSSQAATVACKHLGFLRALDYCTDSCLGSGSGFVYYSEDACTGEEHSLVECDNEFHSSVDCDHSTDVGIICEPIPETMPATVTVHVSTTESLSIIPGFQDLYLYIVIGVCGGALVLVMAVALIVCCTCCVVRRRRKSLSSWRSPGCLNGNNTNTIATGSGDQVNCHLQSHTYIPNHHKRTNSDLSDTTRWAHGSSVSTATSKLTMEKVGDFDDPRDAIEMNGFMNSLRGAQYDVDSKRTESNLSPGSSKGNLLTPHAYDVKCFSRVGSSSPSLAPEVGVSVSTLYVESGSPASPPPGYDELEFLPPKSAPRSHSRL